MPLTPPKLDDRNFESLFREARARIPRYVPEWTDWNESDPGITLLQLQTWLAETILYRMNQLPDLNYVKFLQLLGVEQRPARPAQADLSFTLKEKNVPTDVLVNKGMIVGVSSRDLEQPLFFETDRAFRAISARLTRVLHVPNGAALPDDVTQDNNATGRTYFPLGNPAAVGGALVLGFESKLPFSREEIGLQFYLAEEGQALLARPEIVLCGPPITDSSAPQLAWEWWDGTDWDSLDVTGDETRSLTQSGQVYFRVPGQIPVVPISSIGLGAVETDPPLFYWLRVRLAGGEYATTPRIDRILTNSVRATAALTVRDEAIGSSDGTPNQVMTLRHMPVLADPVLQLEVDEGSDPQPWQQVTDFFGSGPHDAHYVLNRSIGQITFGDGRRGRIPLAGQFNVVARHYRYGGGQAGNVGADTITDLTTVIPEVEEVTNIRQAQGGMDEETLDDTRLRGPRDALKTRSRAVTLEDFELLAREAEGALVARARAYVSEGASGGQIINVVIVPQSNDPKPVPTEVSKRLVCQYLDERRLVTTRLNVMGPLYHDVDASVQVTVMDDADLKVVKNAVQTRLTDYFHPLRGGRDHKGWPFGRDVFYSEVLHEIMALDGVLRVDDFTIKKYLPRATGTANPADLPYFESQGAAQLALNGLVTAETTSASCDEVGAEVIQIVKIGEPPENTPETRWYAAALYSCCDMPVAEGALVALQKLEISVKYLR